MRTEDQAMRRKKQAGQKQKLIRICKVMGTAGLVCGLLVGILLTSLIAKLKSNKAEKVYSEQIQEQKQLNTELETQYGQTLEGRSEKIKDAEWNMILVNEDYPLDETFKVDLEKLDSDYQLDSRVVDAAKEMLAAGEEAGLNMVVISAYRDNEKQEQIFNQTVEQWVNDGYDYLSAYNETKKSVALPGASEHATGLALDIISAEYQELDEKQADTEEAKWLAEHCAEYGFILRYPPEKADVTGITYEPWHYRYVGKEAAKEIMEKGITLEEYYWD